MINNIIIIVIILVFLVLYIYVKLCLKDISDPQDQEEIEYDEFRNKCEFCGSKHNDYDHTCKHCGAETYLSKYFGWEEKRLRGE